MSELYIRHADVTVGARKVKSEDLKINFEVPFDDGPDVNIATVEIYNLSDSTIAGMKKSDQVILNAGYQNDVGSILIGHSQKIVTDWQSQDKITTVTVADAADDWMTKPVKKTFKEGITAKQVITALLPYTGLKSGALSLPVNKVYKSGRTIDDIVGKAIVDVAQDCGAKVHVNKGKLFIREKPVGDEIAYVLDKNHGLIGSPTPIETEEDLPTANDQETAKKTTRKGWKVVTLLNHNLTTDVIIKIVSKTANGYFRIEKGKHSWSGSTFTTEMEVYPK